MSGLDWEKQNRKESIDPATRKDIVRHVRSRESKAKHLAKKAATLAAKEKALQAPYQSGIAVGEQRERERIIKLLEENDHYSIDWLIELIKGEQK